MVPVLILNSYGGTRAGTIPNDCFNGTFTVFKEHFAAELAPSLTIGEHRALIRDMRWRKWQSDEQSFNPSAIAVSLPDFPSASSRKARHSLS